MEAENKMVVTRDCGEGEMGKCWSRGTDFQLFKLNNFWKANETL